MSTRRVWSPRPLAVSAPAEDARGEREAAAIIDVLRREGPLPARELRRRVEARLWGPGRFGPALRAARQSGQIRRDGRCWAAVDAGRVGTGEAAEPQESGPPRRRRGGPPA
jgi:hypothetical protein